MSIKCNSKCGIFSIINCDNFLKCYTTDFIIPTYKTAQANCMTPNLVYCLTCDDCGKQYVGITTRKLKMRIKEHINNINKGIENRIFYKHFQNSCFTKKIPHHYIR